MTSQWRRTDDTLQILEKVTSLWRRTDDTLQILEKVTSLQRRTDDTLNTCDKKWNDFKKIDPGIFGGSNSGQVTCGTYGMGIPKENFQNQKVPVSKLCFEIEKFWGALPIPNGG